MSDDAVRYPEIADFQAELTPDLAGLIFLSSAAYTAPEVWHRCATYLRDHDPVHYVDHPDVNPFYALTKHADVLEVELHPAEFLNEPRAILGNKEADERRVRQGHFVKSLVQMDDPEHRLHRNLTADWFLPKNLAKLEGRLQQLADQSFERMVALGGECDFAVDIAMQYPLQVILAILGLPEEDYPRMLKLTQELFGAEDTDFQRSDDVTAGLEATVLDFFNYFNNLTAQRKAHPTEDLASVIANGMIEGAPIGLVEQIGYYIIVATAGHDTPPMPWPAGCRPCSTIPTSWPASRPTLR